MTTTWTDLGAQAGGGQVAVAEDILARDGGVIRKRGALSVHQHPGNAFGLTRQHMGGTGQHRPAPCLGSYPAGLWINGVGAEADTYGTQESGGGTYINLDRSREGVYVTQSWWWALMGKTKDSVGLVSFYQDTEGWGSGRRSYFTVQIDLAAETAAVRADNGSYPVFATDLGLPGWNDNKFDRTYTSLTTYVGPSDAEGTAFGEYVAFQIGGKVYDLRGAGGGSADYEPQTITTGSSFSGGRNPGIGFSNPVAGEHGGIVIFEMLETIGDVL